MPNFGKSSPLRLGLIGCGRLAELGYLPALSRATAFTLAAVADPDRLRRDQIAASARGRPPARFETAGELLADGRVDAVVIASPPDEHLWQAELAARAGIAALVEKPPAPAFAGAERLAALRPAPWIGFNRRFSHGERVRAGVPANGPLELELGLSYRRRSWRPVAVADDVFTDLVPHLVDLALWLSGSTEARVVAASVAGSRARLELETERGRARISCATDRPHRERVIARSERGTVLASSSEGGAVAGFTGRLPGRIHPLVESLAAQLTAFAAAVRGEASGPLAGAEDGARVMRVLDVARRAATVAP